MDPVLIKLLLLIRGRDILKIPTESHTSKAAQLFIDAGEDYFPHQMHHHIFKG